ncbi:WD40 repeat-like protein [Mycena venus]|uniref:WD40 repeat-like protein n=1 Tax=Mycena venus TaxID=2733690 RepID=A0A8H6X484_9AGAR|nr:WD40 repeat-like protein [Mycena venus]
MVFGLDDGQIHTVQGTDGVIVKTGGVGGKIGNAIVNSRKGLLCFDDPSQGAALYRLDDEHRVITFSVKMAKSRLEAPASLFRK